MLKCFKRITYFTPRWSFILLKDTKNTGLLVFNFLEQKKLIFNFFVNRNWKKLTDSRKRAKILADNRKSHHPIETLYQSLNAKPFGSIAVIMTTEAGIWLRIAPSCFLPHLCLFTVSQK